MAVPEKVKGRVIDAHSHIGEMDAWAFYNLKEPVKPTVYEFADAGAYLGHHPANSDNAIQHLVDAIDRNAGYLLVPDPSRWWLDHYGEFATYLTNNFEQVLDLPGICVLFDLRPEGVARDVVDGTARKAVGEHGVQSRF